MHEVFSHWSASWPALLCYAIVASAHLAGLRRLRPTPDRAQARDRRNQAVLFQAGLLVAALALVSPMGYWSDVYLWVRACQFLVLGYVSSAFMVLGAPWSALRAAASRSVATRPGTDGPDRPARYPVPAEDRGPGRQPWLLARPLLAVLAANIALLGWQLPVLFDAVKTSTAVALACHACYLAAGLVLWLQLIGSRPFSPATGPLRRVPLVVGTVGATTVLGMLLVFGSGVLYPVYAGAAHHVMTLLEDQQLSGAVIWLGSLPPLMSAAVALLLRWLSDEESAELSADLDRLLTPRKNAWSARPGVR